MERNKSGVDVSTLVDEQNFKQTPMFSVSLIPEDSQAVKMAQVLKDMGVSVSQVDTLN